MTTSSTGAGLLARLLADMGVGLTTGRLDESFADLPDCLARAGVRHVRPRTEAAAVQMAAARSHVTGGLAVVFVAGVQGVLHALAAVASAQAAGARLLLISSTRRDDLTGPARAGLPDALDATRVTAPVVTRAARVTDVRRVPELLARAVRSTWRGAPGVAHLEIPNTVLHGPVPSGVDADPTAPTATEPAWRAGGDHVAVAAAAGLLVRAARPVVHVGRGAVHSGAEQQVRDLVTMLDCAVTTTFGARGVVPEDDRHVVAPVHPGVVDDVRTDADVVLVVGADLGESDWWGREPNWASPDEQAVVQVDIDVDAIARNRPVEVPIVGDAKTVLSALVAKVRALGERDTTARRHWLGDQQAAVRRSRAKLDQPLAGEEGATGIHPAAVVATARVVLADDTTWVFDGGHTRRWGQFHVPALQPRFQLGVGGLPMAGAGLGLGMGARLERPGAPVCCLVGDGALVRQLEEVATSVEQGLPLLIIVFVDGDVDPAVDDDRDGDGQRVDAAADGTAIARPPDEADRDTDTVAVRGLRDLMQGSRADQVRFDLVARALGAWGEYVDDPDRLHGAVERAVACGRTAVLHVCVDRVDHTWSPEAGTFRARRSARPRLLVDAADDPAPATT